MRRTSRMSWLSPVTSTLAVGTSSFFQFRARVHGLPAVYLFNVFLEFASGHVYDVLPFQPVDGGEPWEDMSESSPECSGLAPSTGTSATSPSSSSSSPIVSKLDKSRTRTSLSTS